MRMYDVITNKKNGLILSDEEIEFAVTGFTKGTIPDYQMSALLMAICLKGMNKEETSKLTLCMANSGDLVDLSEISGIKVDKHSTGGVGDKTSLVISPIVAACAVPVAKMSGRGLGHTGGTVDKLESIPGLKTAFSKDEFIGIVQKTGLCIAGQSGNLAPADKKLYGLRDVTATVDSIPLIAASIMSKKIAAGSDSILLDVKTGSGAFMKTLDDSILLAKAMVDIGEAVGRKMAALITDMDRPLGFAIGNSLEIMEVVETLKMNGPADLTRVCIQLASNMLYLADKGSLEDCEKLVMDALKSGRALSKLGDMVEAQGGDRRFIEDTDQFEKAEIVHQVKAAQSGYIYAMDAEKCGIASVVLGAGRETSDAAINFSSGIKLFAKTGDFVNSGDRLAEFYTSTLKKSENKIQEAEKLFLSAIVYSEEPPAETPLVFARIDKNGVERYK